MGRMSWVGALTRFGVAAAAIALGASQAFAAPVISVDITSAGGGYGYAISQEGVANPDGTFSLSGIAGGAAVGASFQCDWSITVNQDPSILNTFSMTNITAVTQQYTMNVTLPIALLAPTTVQGGYFGDALNGTTYTDANLDSSVTLATVGANPFYSALVNGILSQGLGSFVLTANSGPPGVQGDISQQTWGAPIPSAPFGPANVNIRIRWQFSLSPGDSMSTQGFFQVERTPAPEPATVALVGLGIAALVAARHRA